MVVDPRALEAFIKASGLSYKSNSVSFILRCPRCQKDKKLYIRKRDGLFCCWVCKETTRFYGKPEYALAELLNEPVHVIRQKLYGEQPTEATKSIEIDLSDFFETEDDFIELDWLEAAPALVFPHDYYPITDKYAKLGREYLNRRGIPTEVAEEYGLRYAPVERRVIFPVYVGDKLLGWQGRLVVPDKFWDETYGWVQMDKVLSSKDIPRDRVWMFQNRLQSVDHAVLTEGPVDAIKMSLAGGNVAAMGKAVSKGQIEAIKNSGIEKVYLALDPDASEELNRLVREFSDLKCYRVVIPQGLKDIGEASIEEAKKLFDRAIRVNSSQLFVHVD